jgi:GntR family transcriptional regulator/MocR family aminotransferase
MALPSIGGRRRTGPAHLASIALDPAATQPLNRQLYFAVRDAILDARLQPGARLPSSRALARELAVSRNTVMAAFEQLLAEGYIEGRVGAGSYVSRELPEETLHARAALAARRRGGGTAPGLSRRGAELAGLPDDTTRPRAFSPGLPELAAFPFEDWARLLAKHWRAPPRSFLIGGDPAGHRPLREAIAAYLGAARAVTCTAEQVFIVSGAQQALDLTVRVLIDPGDRVWVEEPGYPGLRGVLLAGGADLVPVAVDAEGLDVDAGRALAQRARMACVSPSHQYPLGATLSLSRRLALLDWASEADAFVLEDDYDSEYRYAGKPLAALQGLDADGRVIYVGTMSKVMFPGLRLGYMVVPPHLVAAFRAVRRLADTHPPMSIQPALAEFIDAGHLSAHIRRMRSLYAERQEALLRACRSHLGRWLDIAADEAGMHLVASMRPGLDDRAIARTARAHGIEAPALSSYYHALPPRQGLLLGYAGISEAEIEAGARRLAQVLDQAAAGAAA